MANNYVEIVMNAFMVPRGGAQKPVANVYCYRRTTNSAPLVNAHVETAFQASVGAAILAASSVDYTQTGTTVRQIDDATALASNTVEAGVGATATDRMPDYVAVTVRLYTGVRGGSGRGRKHFAGILEAHTTGDILSGTGLTLWQAVRDALLAGFTDSDGNVWQLYVLSRSHKVAGVIVPTSQLITNPTTVVANAVTSCVLNKSIGTMRRRKIKSVT